MNDRLKLARAVALQADTFYDESKKLGSQAQRALTGGKRAQMTGLESAANSTLKVADVLDYIKLRTARQQEWRNTNFGPDLLKYIEETLRQKRNLICQSFSIPEDSAQAQEVYLMLIREFIRQLAAQYEYACHIPDAEQAPQRGTNPPRSGGSSHAHR